MAWWPLARVELVPVPRLAGLSQTCPVLPGQAPARGGAASSASAPPGLLRPHAELREPGSAPKLPPEKGGKHPRGGSLPLTWRARGRGQVVDAPPMVPAGVAG